MQKSGDHARSFYGFHAKKGQVTLFVIIALLIVALGVVIYLFYPQISSGLGAIRQDPNSFIQNCVQDDIKSAVKNISLQGGNLNPKFYVLNNDERISYLCYTENYYQTCIVQQPLLVQHIESEIKNGIQNKVKACFDELKTTFEQRGYTVSMRPGDIGVEIVPNKITSTFNYSVTLTRTQTQKYNSFNVVLNNNLYELLNIANSIIDWESKYGDAETTVYMDVYHDLKVEKVSPASEFGSRIYILTNRDTGDEFQFASRSVVYPPGYGFGDIKR